MKTRIRLIGSMIVALAGLCLLNGCSILGYGVGAAIDAGISEEKTLSGWQIDAVEPGDCITVTLADGSQIGGQFIEMQRDTSEYAERYSAYLETESPDQHLPRRGDPIRVTLGCGRRFNGSFVGFDQIGPNDQAEYLIWIEQDDETTFSLPVRRVSATDPPITDPPSEIESFLSRSPVPMLTTVIVENGYGRHRIGVEDVRYTTIPTEVYTGRTMGLLAGLTFDVLTIAAVSKDIDIDFGNWYCIVCGP